LYGVRVGRQWLLRGISSVFAFLRTLAGLTDSQWPYLLILGSSLFFSP
jgi:hypothetical protein